jgi:hypothetical protein
MNRREFITLLGGAAATWPLAARAQQPKKIPRLCFLTFDPGTFQSRSARFEPFFNRLNELGYVDGQTITIDYLSAEGRNDRFAEIAAECLRFKADVIAVTTTPGGLAAKQATQTIPIVMLPLGDPVGVGLVSSIARPEGNVTGTTVMTSELAAGTPKPIVDLLQKKISTMVTSPEIKARLLELGVVPGGESSAEFPKWQNGERSSPRQKSRRSAGDRRQRL